MLWAAGRAGGAALQEQMPCFPANNLGRNSGERDKVPLQNNPVEALEEASPLVAAPLCHLQLQSGLFGFKNLCFGKDPPRQWSSLVLLLLLVCRWCLPDRPGVPKGQERY